LRISRELHDEIGQTLTAIHINLELIKRDIPPPQAELLSRLDESQSLASDVTRRIRRVIRELRPVDIVDHGLIPSLTKYIAEFEARSGIRIIFRYDPLEEDLSLNEKVTIYRIIQESLTNIARHSGANEAKISLLERENMCMNNGAGEADFITSLEITDNGRGIEATGSKVPGTRATTETPDAHAEGEEWKESGGIGLTGIRERVKLLSGTFQISSSPQHGTRISVTLPRREA
ncbi:MAG TPA: sensor histidine kinase, partial [Bacteroidota bacterium]|nr:sensor histidine kinase [Bacteroidota bacterium]